MRSTETGSLIHFRHRFSWTVTHVERADPVRLVLYSLQCAPIFLRHIVGRRPAYPCVLALRPARVVQPTCPQHFQGPAPMRLN